MSGGSAFPPPLDVARSVDNILRGEVSWAAAAPAAPDVGLFRLSAGVLNVSDGAGGNGTIFAALHWSGFGSAAGPAFSWLSDPDTGMYRAAANEVNFSTSGTLRLTISTTQVLSTIPYVTAIGSAGTPAYSFTGDTNTGWYNNGSDQMALSLGGSNRITWNTTAMSTNLVFQAPAGTAAAPAYSFSTDTNTGIYSAGADALGFSTGGTIRITLSTTSFVFGTGTLFFTNTAAAPGYSFLTDSNTGMYQVGADQLGFSTGGTLRLTVSTTDITPTIPILEAAGTAAAPSYSFSADPDTGIYSVAANEVGIAAAGAVVFKAGSAAISFGTFTADLTVLLTGYISINDIGGTPRKLAVFA